MTKFRPKLTFISQMLFLGYLSSWLSVSTLFAFNHPGFAAILINKSFIILLLAIFTYTLTLHHD